MATQSTVAATGRSSATTTSTPASATRGRHTIKVLLASGPHSVRFRKAERACGKRLRRDQGYRFKRSGSSVVLRGGASGAQAARAAGAPRTAKGRGTIRVRGKGLYRGKLEGDGGRRRAAGGERGGARCLRARRDPQRGAVVLAAGGPAGPGRGRPLVRARDQRGGAFDVYDDTRSQVYGGKDSETARTNKATKRTRGEVVRHGGEVATTYFFSTSGGETESVQFGFPGAEPAPVPEGVNDPYDGASPYHRWRVRYSQAEMRVPALRAVLRQAAEDQGLEARRLAADRASPRGRLPRQLQGLGAGAPVRARPAEHLGALPQALAGARPVRRARCLPPGGTTGL